MPNKKDLKPQKKLEYLEALSQQTGQPLSQQLACENGFLRPLAEMLNTLLENPVLRQAMRDTPPPGTKKQ